MGGDSRGSLIVYLGDRYAARKDNALVMQW